MIPPLPIERYPEAALEGLIAREWVQMICGCEDHTINLEPIQAAIASTCKLMREAGWTPLYQHSFLAQLRNDLTELTRAHPVARQFITILDLELECD
jgi:hypothetical protein